MEYREYDSYNNDLVRTYIKDRKKRRIWGYSILTLSLMLLILLLIEGAYFFMTNNNVNGGKRIYPTKNLMHDTWNKDKWYGLCQRNSVKNVADLMRLIKSDKKLSGFYADVNVWKLHKVNMSGKYHVYWQDGGKYYVTKNKLAISSKEAVYTDGYVYIRGHCCNKIVEYHYNKYSKDEPREELLQPPGIEQEIPPQYMMPPVITTYLPPYVPQYYQELPPFTFQAFFHDRPVQRAPINTPELSTIVYLLTGLSVMSLIMRARRVPRNRKGKK